MALHLAQDTANRRSQAAGFFDLPREIRDEIYLMMWLERDATLHGFRYIWRKTDLNHLLINRQFRSEYMHMIQANNRLHLRVEDHLTSEDWYDDDRILTRGLLQAATRSVGLDLRLLLRHDVCGGLSENCTASRSLAVLVGTFRHLDNRLPRLQDIYLKVYLDDFGCARKLIPELRSIVDFAELTKLELLSPRPDTLMAPGEKTVRLAEGSREHGLVIMLRDDTVPPRLADMLEEEEEEMPDAHAGASK